MNVPIWPLICFVVYGAGIWGAIDVIMRGRTAQGATAWALALLFIPWIALPLYFIFGERRFAGYVRARRDGVRPIDQAAAALHEELRACACELAGEHRDIEAMRRLSRMPFTRGNTVDLLIDGKATYEAIFAAIAAAKEYILVQFYIIREDEVGNKLAELLCEARKRGVRVMLLYDEIGSIRLSNSYLARLTAAGCQCSGFRTKRRKQWAFRLNFRNHRKIVVTDGAHGFIGGINIGEEYLGRDPAMGNWRDTHIAITGPAALSLQLSFLEDWYWANRRIPELRWKPDLSSSPASSGAAMLIVPSGPADMVDTCSLQFMHIANCARQRLWLATPYFVPDEEVLGAIQLAALRGVDVRLIVPDRNDDKIVRYSMMSFFEDLFAVGVKVYLFQDGFMHQKVALCDDAALVSTANMDNRSFRINFEVGAVVADADFAGRVAAMLEQDMTKSTKLSPDWLRKRSRKDRFFSRVSRLFSPIQ